MTIPLELEADNPAVVYRESLSKGSYWAVRYSLETIAEILAGEDADPWTFPWEELRYQHTVRLRRELIERYAPATVNKMLSALRGVLKNAWRLGMMDADTYSRAVAIENVRAKVQPKGRAVGQEEILALFRVCAEDESPAGRRDAAMLAVLYGGGLRGRGAYQPASGGDALVCAQATAAAGGTGGGHAARVPASVRVGTARVSE